MVTDLVQIRQLAAAKRDENIEFRRYLTAHHPAHDALRHVAEHVAEQIDCTACANCCRETTVEVGDEDVETIARFLDARPDDVRQVYTTTDPAGGARILKQTADGCIFLAGNLCSVYAARPRPCREFPYLLATTTSLGSRTPSIFGRACLCPIVYNSLEEFKKLTGFRSHHI
ncbi:MAG: YkgJ family cysteine cluster protein [Bryobacteraceae bacterium]